MCVQSIVSLFVWISVSVSGSVNKPLLGKQECIPVGCVLPTSVPVLGVYAQGVSAQEGEGSVCLGGGVSVQGGECTPPGRHPLPVNRITERCKNISFSQLHLQAVNILYPNIYLLISQI